MVKLETKVVCYNCRKIVPKKKAFYLYHFDTYLCEKCYLALLEGRPVRVANWKKRGV